MSSAPSACQLFLVLDDITDRLPGFMRELDRLSSAAEAGPLMLGVDVYYRADTDISLLALRFDRRTLTQSKRSWVIDVATQADVPVLDPERLAAPDRSVFFERYLQGYGLRIDDMESPGKGLIELASLLGIRLPHRPHRRVIQRSSTGTRIPLQPPPIPSNATRDTDSSSTPTPVQRAPTHRLNSKADLDFELEVPGRAPRLARSRSQPSQRTPREASVPLPLRPKATGARVGYGTNNHPALPSPPAAGARTPETARARGKERSQTDRNATIPGRPLARASIVPPLAGDEPTLRVRFQRGDAWVQARVRNLNTREARLASSAPPPLGGVVTIELSLEEKRILVSGVVVAVVTAEASLDGSSCFRVDFSALSSSTRKALITFLREARAKGLSLSPPPARRNTRFPISWPVALAIRGNRFNAAALDISKEGLFVATSMDLSGCQLSFGIPLDRRGPGVQGRARVARHVTEEMARSRGLDRGYGLKIEGLEAQDKRRFAEFLQRVRKRSQRHVAVAAAGKRQQIIARSLASAGYTVTSADSVPELLERAHFDTRPPDVAVLDESVSELGLDKMEFKAAFASHQVPIVDTLSDPPHAARYAVDRLLAVSL